MIAHRTRIAGILFIICLLGACASAPDGRDPRGAQGGAVDGGNPKTKQLPQEIAPSIAVDNGKIQIIDHRCFILWLGEFNDQQRGDILLDIAKRVPEAVVIPDVFDPLNLQTEPRNVAVILPQKEFMKRYRSVVDILVQHRRPR